MKYCPKCKLRASDDGQTCASCGGPLRIMGTAPPEPPPIAAVVAVSKAGPEQSQTHPPAAPVRKIPEPIPAAAVAHATQSGPASPPAKLPPETALSLQLQGLQHAVIQSRRRLCVLAGAAAGLLFLLILLLTWRHFSKVFEFAEIAEVTFDPTDSGTSVEIRYTPKSAGRFEITRTTPRQSEQLTEVIAQSPAFSQQKFLYDAQQAKFRVQYRRGWSLQEQTWSAPAGNNGGTSDKN